MSHEAHVLLVKCTAIFVVANAFNFLVTHFHDIAGGIFSVLSILYLLWRWRREIRKEKRELRKR